MTFGRSKCVLKGSSPMHEEFIDRIRKSLYFGGETSSEDMEVSRPLAEYASELFSEPHKGHSLHRLNRVTAGSVHATPCSLIMALIYLDRLNVTDPSYVRRITPHELFIVSMMISTKFYADYDEDISLSTWAEDGNMSEERLKKLEKEFLNAINWNVYISTEQFFDKLTRIERILAKREGFRRGWLTYTELMQLLPSFTLVKFLFNSITVMTVSYTASVITIASAFLLASQVSTVLQRNLNNPRVVASEDDSDPSSLVENLHLVTQQDQSVTAPTSIIVESNITRSALNIENELMELNKQYHEEALIEEARTRKNELISGLLHDNAFSSMKLMVQWGTSDPHRNWFFFKEEYSDHYLKKFRDLNTLRTLATTVQKLILITAFIYGQCWQFKQLHGHLTNVASRWCGFQIDHASTAFIMLQIFIIYKACENEIFDTTLYLKNIFV